MNIEHQQLTFGCLRLFNKQPLSGGAESKQLFCKVGTAMNHDFPDGESLRRLLMGSVAEQVVRRAPCPVLTMTAPLVTAPPAETSREEPLPATAAK